MRLPLLPLLLLLLLAGTTSLAASPYGLEAPTPEPTPEQPHIGFQGLGDDDFLPFPNFRYRTPFVDADEVRLTASKGMAHWAHRYALAAEKGPRPRLSTLDEETNRRAVVLDSLSGGSDFQWYRRATDFQDALVRRLEGRDTRKLSFAIRSQGETRQRHIFVYQAERGAHGVWTCRFYDPHIPPGDPMRTAGELRFLPGYLGFEDEAPAASWLQSEDVPDPGSFQVSAAWARVANAPTGRHPDEQVPADPFAEVTDGGGFVRLELRQVGLADAADRLGWGVEQTTLELAFRHDPASYEDGVWDAASDHENVPEGYQQSWIGRPTAADVPLLLAVYRRDLPKLLAVLGKRLAYSVVREAGGVIRLAISDPQAVLTEEERFQLRELGRQSVDAVAGGPWGQPSTPSRAEIPAGEEARPAVERGAGQGQEGREATGTLGVAGGARVRRALRRHPRIQRDRGVPAAARVVLGGLPSRRDHRTGHPNLGMEQGQWNLPRVPEGVMVESSLRIEAGARGPLDEYDDSEGLGDAIQAIFPMDLPDATLWWHGVAIPLEYRYDLGVIIEQLIWMLEEVGTSQAGSLRVVWPSNTFRSDWDLTWGEGRIEIEASWESLAHHKERELENLTSLKMSRSEFLDAWIPVLEKCRWGLREAGVTPEKVPDLRRLEGLLDEALRGHR